MFAIVISAKPQCDVLRVRDLVRGELDAGDPGQIDGDLRVPDRRCYCTPSDLAKWPWPSSYLVSTACMITALSTPGEKFPVGPLFLPMHQDTGI